MIDHEKFTFYHIPRTGGTSIYSALYQSGMVESETTEGILTHTFEDSVKDNFKFAVVRNPFDRMVSVYHWIFGGVFENHAVVYVPKLKITFEEWFNFVIYRETPKKLPYEFTDNIDIKEKQMPIEMLLHNALFYSRQFGTVPMKSDLPNNLTYVARYETLNQDWEYIRKQIGCKYLLPHLQKTERKHYREYYDADMRSAMFLAYEKDFNAYDYDW